MNKLSAIRIPSIKFILSLAFILMAKFNYANDDQLKKYHEIDSLNLLVQKIFLQDLDSAVNLAENVLRLAEFNDYDEGRIKALSSIAVIYHNMNKNELAFEYINSSIKFAEKLANEKILGGVLFQRGYIEVNITHYDRAYEDYNKAAELFLNSGDTLNYGNVLNNLGNLYDVMEETDSALYYFKKSYEIVEGTNRYSAIVMSLINLGSVYASMQNYDSSYYYYEKALGIVKNDDLRHKGYILFNLAEVYIHLNKQDSAEVNLLKSLSIGQKINNYNIIAYSYNLLGGIYENRGDLNKAIAYKEKGYESAKFVKDYKALKDLAEGLAETYRNAQKYEEALKFADLVAVYNDSINSKQNTERLAKLRASKEYDAKIAIEKARHKKKLSAIIAISLILALSIGFFIRGYYRQRKKAQRSELGKTELEKDLKQKDVDLLTKTMHLNEKEELIHGLEEKLKQISRDMKPSKSRDVQSLISEIRISKSDNIWQEFESRFSSVNDDFLERLKKKFPGLTPKELRLCSLLRLNLSTKEISALTHQNPLSINKARFRLRKKLDLNNSEVNLTSYIMEF